MPFGHTVLLYQMRCLTADPPTARSTVSEDSAAGSKADRLPYDLGDIE